MADEKTAASLKMRLFEWVIVFTRKLDFRRRGSNGMQSLGKCETMGEHDWH